MGAHLHLLVIKTNKLPELVAFYSALGLVFDYHRHGNGPYHYSSEGDAPVIELYPLSKGVTQPDTTTRLGYTVDDLSAVLVRLKETGSAIVAQPSLTEFGYHVVVLDPDGRKVELTQTGANALIT